MASDYDRLRQSHREALEQAEPEPQPDAEAARRNAQERAQFSIGPAPGMAQNNQWAHDYDKRVQAHQAARHAADQDKARDTADIPDTPEQPTKPTEQEKIEARRGLNDEHAAARQAEGIGERNAPGGPDGSNAPDGPEKEQRDIDQYRRAGREVADRDQGGSARPSPTDQYRRDFGDRTLER